MRTRRAAREWALRILYAHELSHNPIDVCRDEVLANARVDGTLSFCKSLVMRVAEKDEQIDALIGPALEKWDLNRIAVIDHLLLRMGIAEFLYFDDIPFKVTINEYIELAKRYSTAQSGRFVNGILDAVSTGLQKQAKQQAAAAAAAGRP
ncbi:transcription antitermination factor NusB [candidate division KSB1 bacterium]|nr:transcription antitermination factor NusB [candidate division KSB1 bacterium]